MITESEIKEASNIYAEDYNEINDKQVSGLAHYEGAKWAISQMQPEWVPCADRLPGQTQYTYEVCHIDDNSEVWYTKTDWKGVSRLYDKGIITHYKLYVKPQLPIK